MPHSGFEKDFKKDFDTPRRIPPLSGKSAQYPPEGRPFRKK